MILALSAVAFLFGSIPFGFLIGRALYRTDIRKSGSGNIGAMNALRTLGLPGAIAVLLLDAAKGVLPVFLAQRIAGSIAWLPALCAALAVLGHCYSPWLGWRGGKGVATSTGAIFMLQWKAGLVAVVGWMLGALPTTYSSVGSMLATATAPFALWFFTGSLAETLYGVFATLFIFFMHRENILRLRNGTESGISLLPWSKR